MSKQALIFDAISADSIPMLEAAVAAGSSLSALNPNQRSPAACAAMSGQALSLEWLLAHGASLAPDCMGLTPLMLAARAGHANCVRLLATRCDPNARSFNFEAGRSSSTASRSGLCALEWAMEAGHPGPKLMECLSLLAPLSDAFSRDAVGRSLFFKAALSGSPACALMLMHATPEAAKDMCLEAGHSGDSPLLAAARSLLHAHPDIAAANIQAMLSSAPAANFPPSQRQAALLMAIGAACEDAARALLAVCDPRQACPETGSTPLMLAAERGSTGCVKAIIEALGSDWRHAELLNFHGDSACSASDPSVGSLIQTFICVEKEREAVAGASEASPPSCPRPTRI